MTPSESVIRIGGAMYVGRRSVGAAAEAQTLFLRDPAQHKHLSEALLRFDF